MKKCRMCNKNRDISNYHKKKQSKDGFYNICKACSTKKEKIRYQLKSKYLKKYSIEYFYISPTKICTTCKKRKNKNAFSIDKKYKDNCCRHCKSCRSIKTKDEFRSISWQKSILTSIYGSTSLARLSEKYDKDFNLEAMSEITIDFLTKLKEKQNNKCNWFGVDIDFSRNDWLRSPSLDRLDNDKGYTRDNVVLTCRSANLARNKSTVKEMDNFLSELKNSILSKEIA